MWAASHTLAKGPRRARMASEKNCEIISELAIRLGKKPLAMIFRFKKSRIRNKKSENAPDALGASVARRGWKELKSEDKTSRVSGS